jgi:photosystem II stability/assembly factor-like uncharacterized protein
LVALAAALLCAPATAQAADWTATSAPSTVWRGLSFPDAQNGWAVAQGWYLSHTANGGATWTQQSSGIDPFSGGYQAGLWGVDFINSTTGWACGNDGTVIHTTNGGASWTQQGVGYGLSKPNLYGVDFTDALHGCVVSSGSGSVIYTTSDGGATWTFRTPPDGASWGLYAVRFANATDGWTVGAYGAIAATSDGGATWIAQRTGAGSYPTLYGVACVDPTHAWAVGDDGTILATADGTTWVAQVSHTTADLRAVDFADTLHGWAVGAVGTCMVTSDGGATWTPKNSGLGSETMTAVEALGGQKAMAAGGHIFRYGAGGDTTKPVTKALNNVMVKKSKKATLRFRVNDNAAKCTVTITIKKGAAVKKTFVMASAKTNRALSKSFTCALKKGVYTWYVSATDPSGNACAKASSKKLTVK